MADDDLEEFANWFALGDPEGVPQIMDTTRVRLRENRREQAVVLHRIRSLRAQIGHRSHLIRRFVWLSDRPRTPWERYVRANGLTDCWVLVVENNRLRDDLAVAELDLTILRLTEQELLIQLQLDQLPVEPP